MHHFQRSDQKKKRKTKLDQVNRRQERRKKQKQVYKHQAKSVTNSTGQNTGICPNTSTT